MASSSNLESMPPKPTENAGLEKSIEPWEGVEITPERPEWLPQGWVMKAIPRNSGKTKGVIDRYYYDPKNNYRFRSKKEVEYFLQTGTRRTYTPKSKRANIATNTSSAERFDFENPPAKVSWVLSNSSEGSWTPYINNEEVPESIKRVWVAAMEDICSDT